MSTTKDPKEKKKKRNSISFLDKVRAKQASKVSQQIQLVDYKKEKSTKSKSLTPVKKTNSLTFSFSDNDDEQQMYVNQSSDDEEMSGTRSRSSNNVNIQSSATENEENDKIMKELNDITNEIDTLNIDLLDFNDDDDSNVNNSSDSNNQTNEDEDEGEEKEGEEGRIEVVKSKKSKSKIKSSIIENKSSKQRKKLKSSDLKTSSPRLEIEQTNDRSANNEKDDKQLHSSGGGGNNNNLKKKKKKKSDVEVNDDQQQQQQIKFSQSTLEEEEQKRRGRSRSCQSSATDDGNNNSNSNNNDGGGVGYESENPRMLVEAQTSSSHPNVKRFEESMNEDWHLNLFKSYLQSKHMSSLLEFYLLVKDLNKDIKENRSGYEFTMKSICLTYMHHEELPPILSTFLYDVIWKKIDAAKNNPLLFGHFRNLEVSAYNLLLDDLFPHFLGEYKMFNRVPSTSSEHPPDLNNKNYLQSEDESRGKNNSDSSFQKSSDPFDLPDIPEYIKFKKENGVVNVDAATIPKIIQKLTSPKALSETGQDFQYAALLAHQYYTKTPLFIDLLRDRLKGIIEDISNHDEQWKKTVFLPTIIRIISVTKFLFEFHVEYFRVHEDQKKNLLNLITELKVYMEAPANNLYEFVIRKIATRDKTDNEFQFDKKPPKPKITKYLLNTPVQSITFSMLHPVELARQISLNDHRLYRAIKADEYLFMNWTKDTKNIHSPHVIASIQQFCLLSTWVATQIVIMENMEKRVDVLTKLITLAYECFQQNNFNGAMSVISGLQFHYIFRLKRTWELLPEKAWDKWEEMKTVFKPDSNFANLRVAISAAPLPMIPYLGMYLSDLTFIDNEPNFLNEEKTLVNFSKMRYIAAIIQQIQKFQNSAYCFEEVDILQQFLQQLPTLSEPELYQFSLNCEPRAEKGAAPVAPSPTEKKRSMFKRSTSSGNMRSSVSKSKS